MANRLKILREQRQLTQQALGELLAPPVPAVYIHRYESGKVKNIPISTLLKLSAVFGVSTDELLGHDASPGAGEHRARGWKSQAATLPGSPYGAADAGLMQQCSAAMLAAAQARNLALPPERLLALTVALHNHVIAYRTQNPALQPDEAMAALLLAHPAY
jgi:transcriptional regulator with XRE-family HTH domain